MESMCVSVCVFYLSPGKVRRIESFFYPHRAFTESLDWAPDGGIHKLQQMKTKCFQLPLVAGGEWICSPVYLLGGGHLKESSTGHAALSSLSCREDTFPAVSFIIRSMHSYTAKELGFIRAASTNYFHYSFIFWLFSQLIIWFVKCQQIRKMAFTFDQLFYQRR